MPRVGGRRDLLCDLLPNEPEIFSLLALMTRAFARATARADERGQLLLLPEQDRSRWDRPAIKEGLMALQCARRLGSGGSYALQAEIAACHTTAATWEATDWSRILGCYDELLALSLSPVVALNRAVAVCMEAGPLAGLAALAGLEAPLADYPASSGSPASFPARRSSGSSWRATSISSPTRASGTGRKSSSKSPEKATKHG